MILILILILIFILIIILFNSKKIENFNTELLDKINYEVKQIEDAANDVSKKENEETLFFSNEVSKVAAAVAKASEAISNIANYQKVADKEIADNKTLDLSKDESEEARSSLDMSMNLATAANSASNEILNIVTKLKKF
jgi:hypothetical protein